MAVNEGQMSKDVRGSMAREWCMPHHETFSISPVRDLLRRYLGAGMVIVDPFARDSEVATVTNDLDPQTKAQHHMDAADFCRKLIGDCVEADIVLFDPPYSPRQMAEVYRKVGLAGRRISQTGGMYKEVRKLLGFMLKRGGLAFSFGWNSSGFGALEYERVETLLVCHGAAHNDTICVVERKL